jgi:hypothetical protein
MEKQSEISKGKNFKQGIIYTISVIFIVIGVMILLNVLGLIIPMGLLYSVVAIIVLILLLGLYFLPVIVAFIKEKKNAWAIFALNLCLGWTLIGWVIALVWALTYEKNNN